ncbi:Hypothetical protein UVM_LOCUS325 [uncultured virus]|nr:Hypothetical protein UVM_LOCUS325 [uncultured virus]
MTQAEQPQQQQQQQQVVTEMRSPYLGAMWVPTIQERQREEVRLQALRARSVAERNEAESALERFARFKREQERLRPAAGVGAAVPTPAEISAARERYAATRAIAARAAPQVVAGADEGRVRRYQQLVAERQERPITDAEVEEALRRARSPVAVPVLVPARVPKPPAVPVVAPVVPVVPVVRVAALPTVEEATAGQLAELQRLYRQAADTRARAEEQAAQVAELRRAGASVEVQQARAATLAMLATEMQTVAEAQSSTQQVIERNSRMILEGVQVAETARQRVADALAASVRDAAEAERADLALDARIAELERLLPEVRALGDPGAEQLQRVANEHAAALLARANVRVRVATALAQQVERARAQQEVAETANAERERYERYVRQDGPLFWREQAAVFGEQARAASRASQLAELAQLRQRLEAAPVESPERDALQRQVDRAELTSLALETDTWSLGLSAAVLVALIDTIQSQLARVGASRLDADRARAAQAFADREGELRRELQAERESRMQASQQVARLRQELDLAQRAPVADAQLQRDADELRRQLQAAQQAVAGDNADLAQANQAAEQLRQQLAEARRQTNVAQQQAVQAQANVRAASDQAAAGAQQQRRALEERIAQLEREAAAVQGDANLRARDLNAREQQAVEAERRLGAEIRRAEQAEQAVADLRARMAVLEEAQRSGAAGQQLTVQEKNARIRDLQAQVQRAVADAGEAANRADQMRQERDRERASAIRLQQQLDQAAQSAGVIAASVAAEALVANQKIQGLEARLLEQRNAETTRARASAADLRELRAELQSATEANLRLQAELRAATAAAHQTAQLRADVVNMAAELEDMREELEQADAAIAANERIIASLEAEKLLLTGRVMTETAKSETLQQLLGVDFTNDIDLRTRAGAMEATVLNTTGPVRTARDTAIEQAAGLVEAYKRTLFTQQGRPLARQDPALVDDLKEAALLNLFAQFAVEDQHEKLIRGVKLYAPAIEGDTRYFVDNMKLLARKEQLDQLLANPARYVSEMAANLQNYNDRLDGIYTALYRGARPSAQGGVFGADINRNKANIRQVQDAAGHPYDNWDTGRFVTNLDMLRNYARAAA